MPSYRRLPSGLWQATVLTPVRLPSGRPKRASKTHVSKVVVREWATKLEAAIDAGRYVDPRAGDITVREYHARWVKGRVVADATADKAESHWRVHIEPAWGGHPLTAITRPSLRAWVRRMIDDNTGPWTIQGVVSTLSALLSSAADDGLLPANPCAGLKLPRVDAKPVFFWTKPDAVRLVAALNGHGLMCDLDLHVGLRWGELAGLRCRWVDHDSGIIHVVGVQTRTGWREYPKSRMSRRSVPIPAHLGSALAVHCAGKGGDDYVFPAPEGGPWDDTNFRRRVFTPAIKDAGVPKGTPHDMRHTAASWLVQRGVDIYRVQALLGHENVATTQRYAHLAPDAFDRIREAWNE